MQEAIFPCIISKNNNNPDVVKVYGVKKQSNLFFVGEYRTFNFNTNNIEIAKKEQIKENIYKTLKVAGIALMAITVALSGKYLQKKTVEKEIPQKIIQVKDSVADSLNTTNFGKIIQK